MWTMSVVSLVVACCALIFAVYSVAVGGVRGLRQRVTAVEDDLDHWTTIVQKRDKRYASGKSGEKRSRIAEAREIAEQGELEDAAARAQGRRAPSHEGSGLGLPGQLDIETFLGKGTKFPQ